ncbi:MAG: hypothetical protein IJU40_02200, partial [Desulfovibrionaceae bacterium]|nr:hypothetical protein [Desulfovibrionaceae bacterium]
MRASAFFGIFLALAFTVAVGLETFASSKQIYEEALTLPKSVPLDTVKTALQCRAWLHFLKNQAQLLPEKRSLLLQIEPSDLMAITGLLYQVESQSFVDDAQNTLKVTLTCSRDPHAQELANLAIRNPELLNLSRHFLNKIGEILLSLDKHWPNARFFANYELNGQEATFNSKEETWSEKEWLSKTNNLKALLAAYAALTPSLDGWFTQDNSLASLEEAHKNFPEEPMILLLLGEAELKRGLYQQSIKHCSQCLNIVHKNARARYIRALAHWEEQQLGLAENDLSLAIEEISPKDNPRQDWLLALRTRGAIRMLLGRNEGMCEDFET